MTEIITRERSEINLLSSKKELRGIKKEEDWGSVKLIQDLNDDPLLKELKLLDSLLCEVSRVNNLIVDLQLTEFKPHPNSLLAKTIKKNKEEPFLSLDTMVTPG